MKIPASEFEFRQCTPPQIEQILFIQDEAFRKLSNADLLRRNTPEMLIKCLSEPHFTLGAFYNGELIAFGILYDGKQTDENIGYDIGISEDRLNEVVNFKLIIVLPDYRGNGLQKMLISKLADIAKSNGKTIMCATVSPDNLYSIRNFESCGFVFHSEKIKYGGLKRNVYYKIL